MIAYCREDMEWQILRVDVDIYEMFHSQTSQQAETRLPKVLVTFSNTFYLLNCTDKTALHYFASPKWGKKQFSV